MSGRPKIFAAFRASWPPGCARSSSTSVSHIVSLQVGRSGCYQQTMVRPSARLQLRDLLYQAFSRNQFDDLLEAMDLDSGLAEQQLGRNQSKGPYMLNVLKELDSPTGLLPGIQGRPNIIQDFFAVALERIKDSRPDLYDSLRGLLESDDFPATNLRRVELASAGTPTIDAARSYDVFICHASEDKDDFVRPLAQALSNRGSRVWYDEFTLKVGDSLRREIDRGLRDSRFGVVVLSPDFFAKEWPQRELDGLVAKEVGGKKAILPVWHKVTADDVRRYSLTLVDRVAASSSDGLDVVVKKLFEAMSE